MNEIQEAANALLVEIEQADFSFTGSEDLTVLANEVEQKLETIKKLFLEVHAAFERLAHSEN